MTRGSSGRPGRLRRLGIVAAFLGASLPLAGSVGTAVASAATATSDGEVTIEVLSNRADLVSGGDALVRVTVPSDASVDDVEVTLDGRPVDSLVADGDRTASGLIEGLAVGDNEVRAVLPDGRGATLTITNHPSGGPVIAGPQVQPWICDNAAGGNGEPVDDQCTTEPTYEYQYQSAPGVFSEYDPDNPPPYVATTTTDEGETVPYIVRVEHGTMDRGNYLVGVLWDMEADAPAAWNHKLLVPFGASTAVHHGSGAPTDVMDDTALGRGFMVANNSLNVQGQNANGIVSAEALMMLKERIVEQYGSIRYTIGNGCSGGAIQQHLLVSMYPGLVDGLQPNCSFTEMFTTGQVVMDCHLLLNYFDNTSPGLWANEADRRAVHGHRDTSDCVSWDVLFSGAFEPSRAQNCDLPQEQVYDEDTNPEGVRCTIPDYMVSVLGRRPPSFWGDVEQQLGEGFGQLPLDTVGVQYGLNALLDGDITPAQFADLNAKIGGITIDNDYMPERVAAVPEGIALTYRSGLVTDARQLTNVPIIDLRGYSESGEIHTNVYSWATRARLDDVVGDHENQIIWTFAPTAPIAPIPTPMLADAAFDLMDRWLTAIEDDTRDVPQSQKVRDNKPDDAVDRCFAADVELPSDSCDTVYPVYSTPRLEAGAPLRNDNLKCQLKPLVHEDYPVTFTDEEWALLEQAFPTGVCDWSKPAPGQVPAATWLTYETGAGGTPLGSAPVSVPFGPAAAPGATDGPTLPATGGSGALALGSVLALAAMGLRRAG